MWPLKSKKPSKPTEPNGIKAGHVPAHAFDHMSAEDIKGWLKGRFQDDWEGYCPSVVDIGGAINWTTREFERFPHEVKKRFGEALVHLIEEVTTHPAQWAERESTAKTPPLHDPAHELFNFTHSIIGRLTTDAPEFIQSATPKLLDILRSDTTSAFSKVQALDLLADTGYSADKAFWLENGKKVGGMRAAWAVASGLSINDPVAAFEYLGQQPVESMRHAGYLASHIAERHGSEVAEKCLDILAQAHPEARALMVEIRKDFRQSQQAEKAEGR